MKLCALLASAAVALVAGCASEPPIDQDVQSRIILTGGVAIPIAVLSVHRDDRPPFVAVEVASGWRPVPDAPRDERAIRAAVERQIWRFCHDAQFVSVTPRRGHFRNPELLRPDPQFDHLPFDRVWRWSCTPGRVRSAVEAHTHQVNLVRDRMEQADRRREAEERRQELRAAEMRAAIARGEPVTGDRAASATLPTRKPDPL